jgi:hypothetical protein
MRSLPLHIAFVVAIAITCASCASSVESPTASPAPRSADPPSKVAIGRFSEGSLAGWKERSFSGSTAYEINQVNARGALSASCDAAASGLYRQGPIDLDETPYLHWSWRVDRTYGQDLDEHQKSGDDFPARVFVVVKGGVFGLQARALNYVWSSSQDSGARWSSPYSDRVKMIAVDAGPPTGQWHTHRRDVRADFERAYGFAIDTLDAVAVMTDCDDSKSRGIAHYGDIYFTDEADSVTGKRSAR